jgi:hypothetical protein
MRYLVEIIPESITDMQAAALSLAQLLKLDPAKAAALLKRNPVTKPVSQAEAEKVARLFTKAGIEVFIRSEEELALTATMPEVPTPRDSATHDSQSRDLSGPAVETEAIKPTFGADMSQRDDTSTLTTPAEDFVTSKTTATTLPDAAKIPSVVPEIDHASDLSSDSPTLETDPGFGHVNQNEETFKIPSGFFTPVPPSSSGGQAADEEQDSPLSQDTTLTAAPAPSGWGKIVFASLVPGLLALAGVFTALYLLGLPLLRSQQRSAAETTAVALASSLGGWIGDVSLDNPALSQQVQSVIANTRTGLRERGIDFVLLSDPEGNQLAGWYKELSTPGVPDTVTGTEQVRNQLSRALGAAVAAEAGTALETSDPDNRLTIDGETLELAAEAVLQGSTPVGTVVVGTSQQHLTANLQQPLVTTLLAGILPLLLGILISLLISRNRQQNQ